LASHERAVDRLCTEYGDTPPDLLVPRLVERLYRIDQLRERRPAREAYRRIQTAAGWAHLLLAACYTDLGQVEIAYTSRDTAEYVGRESEDPNLLAWSLETSSWIALWQGGVHASLDAALEGQRIAPAGSSAWFMTACKIASAQAKLGRRREAERELERVHEELARRTHEPENPQHHFVFDAPKVHQYAADVFAWLHAPRKAAQESRAVIDWAGNPTARTWNPTRTATAQVNLGQSLLEQGEIEAAVEIATRAFDTFLRRDTIIRAGELDEQLRHEWPNEPAARNFHEQVVAARRAIGM
jgi:tetratricopeptide (TPR) repeat protein